MTDPTGLGNVVGQYDSSGTLIAHYNYGLGLASVVAANGVGAYYDFDGFGSTVGLTSSSGAIQTSYAYDPFGSGEAALGSVVNPFQFLGQEGIQTEAGAIDSMRARFYSPALGRFITPDPLGLGGGDLNVLRYVDNSPTNESDPTGEGAYDTPEFNQGEWENYNDPSLGLSGLAPGCRTPTPKSPTPVPGLTPTPGAPVYLVASHDPNELLGPVGYGPQAFVAPGSNFPYEVQFENSPSATAPAHEVEITDQLDPNLDWSTFALTGSASAPSALPFRTARSTFRRPSR